MAYPQYKSGCVISSRDPTNYICHICKIEGGLPVEQHLSEEMHCLKYTYFRQYFEDRGHSEIFCKICKTLLDLNKAVEHATSHGLIPWSRPKNEVSLLFNNFISFCSTQRYCHVCNVKCDYWFTAISHIEDLDHKKNLSSMVEVSLTEKSLIPESIHKFGLAHAIFKYKIETFFCSLCKCEIETSFNSIMEHAGNSHHVKNELQFDHDIESAKSYRLSFNNNRSTEIENHSDDDIDIVICVCKICQAEVSGNDIEMHMNSHNYNGNREINTSIPTSRRDSGQNCDANGVEVVDLISDDDDQGGYSSDGSVIIETDVLQDVALTNNSTNNNIGTMVNTNRTNSEICTVIDSVTTSLNQSNENEQVEPYDLRKTTIPSDSPVVAQHTGNNQKSLDKETTLIDETNPAKTAPTKLLSVSQLDRQDASSSNITRGNDSSMELMEAQILNLLEITFTKCSTCDWVILNDLSSIEYHKKTDKHHLRLQSSLLANTNNRTVTIEPIFSYHDCYRYFIIDFYDDVIKVLRIPVDNGVGARAIINWCNVCETGLAEDVSIHMKNEVHLQILHGIRRIVGSTHALCKLCNTTIMAVSLDTMMSHINESSHQNNWMINHQPTVDTGIVNYRSIYPYFPKKHLPDGIETIEGESFCVCTVCDCVLTGSEFIANHTKDPEHMRDVKKTCIIKIRDTVFACFICFNFVRSLKSLKAHVGELFHNRMVVDMESFDREKNLDTLLRLITKHGANKYSCSLCNITLEGDPVLPLEHTFGRRHRFLLSEKSPTRSSQYSARTPRDDLPNCITTGEQNEREFSDNQTQMQTVGEGHQLSITKSSSHQTALLNIEYLNEYLPDCIEVTGRKNHFFCTICKCRMYGLRCVEQHLDCQTHRDSLTARYSANYLLLVPEQPMSNVPEEESMSEMTKESGYDTKNLPQGVEWLGRQYGLFCTICNCQILEDDSIEAHVATIDHMTKGPEVLHRSGHTFVCDVCNCRDILDVPKHLGNVQHWLNKEATFPADPEIKRKRLYDLPEGVKRIVFDTRYWCEVCSKLITSTLKHAMEHVETESHKNNQLKVRQQSPKTLSSATSSSSYDVIAASTVEKTQLATTNINNDSDEIELPTDSPDNVRERKETDDEILLNENETIGQQQVASCSAIPGSKKLWNFRENPMYTSKMMTIINNNRYSCLCCGHNVPSDEKRGHLMNHLWPKFSRVSTKLLDLDIEDGVNIYKIHELKKNNFQLGAFTISTVDKKILFCLICRKMIKNDTQICYDHLCSIKHLDYIQLMIEDDRKFDNYPDQLSDLALAREYIEELNNSWVRCHACTISLSNSTQTLNEHIETSSHAKFRASCIKTAEIMYVKFSSLMNCNFYSIQNYFCVICKKQFSVEMEFRQHTNSKEHTEHIEKLKNIKEELIFDHCAICGSLWFGFSRTYGYHMKCRTHKKYITNSPYLVNKLPSLADSLLKSVSHKIYQFVQDMDNLRSDMIKREERVVHDLEKICKKKYSKCVAHPFGDGVAGLEGSYSHLNIFLECSTNDYSLYDAENSLIKSVDERLEIVKSRLRKNPITWKINTDIKTNSAIISAQYLPSKIDCIISLDNGLKVETTKLVKKYCEKFSDCRTMIIFVRNWMNSCELTSDTGMTNSAVNWMIIFFLQHKGILPCVAELIRNKNQSRLIGGWETSIDLDFEGVKSDESVEQLLAEFFTFYADFDYRSDVICPLLGRTVKKIDFQKQDQLPAEMKPYLQYMESSGNPEPLGVDSILCIQHPFELSENVAKTVEKNQVYKIKSFCLLSVQSLATHRVT